MSAQTAQADLGTRPAAATGRGHLLRAEMRRLRHRRLVLVLTAFAAAALVGGMTIAFFVHNQDVAGARADTLRMAQQQRAECVATGGDISGDPGGADTQPEPLTGTDAQEACGPPITDVDQIGYDPDPRFLPDPGLAVTSTSIAVGGALLAALVGATGVGADWSSRAMITLLTWEPRRLRLLGTRYAAIALICAGLGVFLQLLGLALGAITVSARGTWGDTGAAGAGMSLPGDSSMLGADTFWRDLLSLQLRGVVLMVLTGVLAAGITTLARHTGGLLGVLFGWFAVAETALRAFGWERGWDRWLLSSNIDAFLSPGGKEMVTGERLVDQSGQDAGAGMRTVLVSNLDALLYLGCVTAVFVLLAGLFLRRRDL